MTPKSTGQGPGQARILFENDYALSHKSPSSTVVNGGRQRWTRAAGWLGKTTTPQTAYILESPTTSGGLVPCRPAARMVRAGGSRFSSREFQLFPPLARVLSGMRKKAAFPLQRVSAIFREGLRPSPAPEQFSPVAGGTLQIWPTGFRSLPSIVMQRNCREVQSFSGCHRKKLHTQVPGTATCNRVSTETYAPVPGSWNLSTCKNDFFRSRRKTCGAESGIIHGIGAFPSLPCSPRAPPAHQPRNCTVPWAR